MSVLCCEPTVAVGAATILTNKSHANNAHTRKRSNNKPHNERDRVDIEFAADVLFALLVFVIASCADIICCDVSFFSW